MRKIYSSFCCLLLSASLQAQTPADYAVQLQATSQASPPQIRLQWKKHTGATAYIVERKGKEETAWNQIASLPGSDSVYTDAGVIADSAYEYKVTKTGGSYQGTGYIYAGIRAPAIHSRGTLILLVDTTFTDSCRAEIAQLMGDLRGDGWAILRHDVGRAVPVPAVRSLIQADYASRPDVRALLLLGHIPVPYSGELNPDAHPDHLGAWPTDTYYADVDGSWTDFSVNNSTATRSQNRNVPGDGKWDQTFLASEAELQTGRIDFANMPAIKRTEIQLMRNYLAKLHNYKTGLQPLIRKGLVDDHFGPSSEAFAANAWRLFPTTIGRANILTGDLVPALEDSAYQWAYGCGPGYYNSASGVGVTANFDTNAVKGIFTILFGSYFGDWDAQNNFLRAPLCAKEPALASFWAGRPNWFLHHMGLGETIGYSTRLSQNNNIGLYTPANHGIYWIHVNLMGDPSLRTDYIRQPQSLTISPVANAGANLSWSASPEPAVIGYYVYRSDATWGTYSRISGLLTTTAFTDASGSNGKKYYLVRPVTLQQTPSGAYYNPGVGIVDSATVSYPLGVPSRMAANSVSLFPNPASDRLNIVLEANIGEEATATLINAAGGMLRREPLKLHTGANSFSMDISGLPAGVYMLSIETRDGMVMKKWSKWDKL